MDKAETLSRLLNLQGAIKKKKELRKSLKEIEKTISDLMNYVPHALEDFDNAHKEQYIISKIGEPPPKPNILKKLAPWTRKEVQVYKTYVLQYKEYEERYYLDYKIQREQVVKDEQEAQQIALSIHQDQRKSLLTSIQQVKDIIKSDDILDDEQKCKRIVGRLIRYFQTNRTDNLKDAINLYYKELHQQRLEDLANKQLEIVSKTVVIAEEAKRRADEAYEYADKAYERADEAYDHADEAYDLADDAYDRAGDASERASESLDRISDALDRIDDSLSK